MDEEVRIALIEQKIGSFENILTKLDNTIDKLNEVNSNIIKMLAVHEQKVVQAEKTDEIFMKMFTEVNKKIDEVEKELKDVQRTRWTAVGIGIVLAIIISGLFQVFKYAPEQHLQQIPIPPSKVI
jgi:uncharacterized membrane protein YukC